MGAQGLLGIGESQHICPWPPSHLPYHLTGLILGLGPYTVVFFFKK